MKELLKANPMMDKNSSVVDVRHPISEKSTNN